MCGVVGVLAYGDLDVKQEKIRQEAMRYLSTELLELTQPRGKEATGIATLFDNCDYMGLKMGVPAQEFISRFGNTENDFEGYLNIWRNKKSKAKIVIGHCRKPSATTNAIPEDNNNNHPIKVGDIVGVHNGTLTNHDTIFDHLNCGRDGKVDSEAIFRLIHHFTNNGTEPFTKEALTETCKRLSGTYACLTFSGNNPYQLAAFRDGRPLEICIIRPLKLLLIASEAEILKTALFNYNKMAVLYQAQPGKYIKLSKGDVALELLKDDSLFIFNINLEIDENTKIEDLYITDKVSRTDKIWKFTSTYVANKTTTTNSTSTNANITKSKTETKEVDAVSHKSVENKQDSKVKEYAKNIGMAWCPQRHTYVEVSDVEKHGNVEVDLENKTLTDSGKGNYLKDDVDDEDINTKLEESDLPLDDLVSNPVIIDNIEGNEESEVIVNTRLTKETSESDEEKNVVDLSVYPDVIEKAIAATKDEPSFSTVEELANAIEITNLRAMENMALYSLANRIKKFFYKKGWQDGYIAHMKEVKGEDSNSAAIRNLLIRTRDKANKATSNIRLLKTVIKIYETFSGKTVVPHEIDKEVSSLIEKGSELKSKNVSDIFKEVEINAMPILKQIEASINTAHQNL